MSLIRGRAGETWTLQEAVNALAESVRQAGRPTWLLPLGLIYPPILLVFDMQVFPGGAEVLLTGEWKEGVALNNQLGVSILESVLLFLVLFVPFMRLVPGLATVTSRSVWNQFAVQGKPPGLRDAFRAGKGLWLSATGLYFQTFLMIGMGFLICLGPVALGLTLIGLDEEIVPFFLLPILLFLLLYSLVISVLYQLSLHSLTHNRRGVGSAMQHAWRLMQAHPWAVGRTLLVDTVLSVTVWTIMAAAVPLFGLTCVLIPFLPVLAVALVGFVGVTRAGFWSRAYRSLGGVTQEDGLPGLPRPSLAPPS